MNQTGIVKGRKAIEVILSHIKTALRKRNIKYVKSEIVRAKLLLITMKQEQMNGKVGQNGKKH